MKGVLSTSQYIEVVGCSGQKPALRAVQVGWSISPTAWTPVLRGVHDQLVCMAPHPMQFATQTYPLATSWYSQGLSLLGRTLGSSQCISGCSGRRLRAARLHGAAHDAVRDADVPAGRDLVAGKWVRYFRGLPVALSAPFSYPLHDSVAGKWVRCSEDLSRALQLPAGV